LTPFFSPPLFPRALLLFAVLIFFGTFPPLIPFCSRAWGYSSIAPVVSSDFPPPSPFSPSPVGKSVPYPFPGIPFEFGGFFLPPAFRGGINSFLSIRRPTFHFPRLLKESGPPLCSVTSFFCKIKGISAWGSSIAFRSNNGSTPIFPFTVRTPFFWAIRSQPVRAPPPPPHFSIYEVPLFTPFSFLGRLRQSRVLFFFFPPRFS